MRKRISLVLAAGLTLFVPAGIVACKSKDRDSGANAAEIPSATVVAVTRGNIAHTLNLAGQFQPYQVVDVHAKVSGYIKHIYVDIGDKLRRFRELTRVCFPEVTRQVCNQDCN